jgi:hypothetical protein
MAETPEPEMSRQAFSVAYAGAGRPDDHTMDVEAALLAFGKLIREGNAEFNGKRAKARVFVYSDFEHKCFNINSEALVSFGEQIKALIGDDNVKTAKEVLEWIGIVKPTVVAGLTYLGYLRWKNGRKVTETTELTDRDEAGLVRVSIEGESNSVVVHSHVYKLSENPRALRATRDAFAYRARRL